MKDRKPKKPGLTRKRFDRAMIESTDVLGDLLGEVDLPIAADDYLVFELARLLEDGEPSFQNDDFRFLIEQGIRIHANPSTEVRAALVERLRRSLPDMSAAARRIAPDVIGAIEDVDFSLDRIGAVVRAYTNQLFTRLESRPDASETEENARRLAALWRQGAIDHRHLLLSLRDLGPDVAPAVADLLFESIDDPAVASMALTILETLPSPTAARVLAYVISEPILTEPLERRAGAILQDMWPLARPYVLYRLREHTHEDLPYRWFELMVAVGEPRAVDRILEEVVAHARDSTYREDLLTILGLIDRSKDPGRTGKVLRLMTEESAPDAVQELMELWIEESAIADAVEQALERWQAGKVILVPAGQDFHTFARQLPNCGQDEARRDWNAAYHESLGWQQWSAAPRGPVETACEHEIEAAMMRELSLNPGLDDLALREQMESFRENWLVAERDGAIPLVAIFRERPRGDPWREEAHRRDLNNWYIRAAQFFDEGDFARARQYLDLVLQIEPGYPFATALDRLMRERGI